MSTHADIAGWPDEALQVIADHNDRIRELEAEKERLRGVVEYAAGQVRDAVERMWENEIGVCYVEAGVRESLARMVRDPLVDLGEWIDRNVMQGTGERRRKMGFDELRGAFPDFTGGMPAEDFIRRQRSRRRATSVKLGERDMDEDATTIGLTEHTVTVPTSGPVDIAITDGEGNEVESYTVEVGDYEPHVLAVSVGVDDA